MSLLKICVKASLLTGLSVRDSVRASLRLMVKRILRKYKYPPSRQEEAVKLVLKQAETLSAEWVNIN